MQHVPVIIAGGGPVGMTLARDLARRGIQTLLIERNPTIKMLALAFLIMIGVVLVADGVGQHIERGYIYFAMAFSTLVEMLNLRNRKKENRG